MFPANLSRSAHYLNLQPQQPLLTPPHSLSPSLPHHRTLSHLILLSYFVTIVLSFSPPTHPPCVSLSPFLPHLNFPGLMFLQECSLLPLHTTGLWGGWRGVSSWWEGLRFLARFGEERRILGFCLPLPLSLPRLASLCDLWSLTPCLHMGGHGCGKEGVLKWEEWGRV